MSAEQRLVTAPAFRPRLSAVLAIGALGLGLLATPAGTAIANPEFTFVSADCTSLVTASTFRLLRTAMLTNGKLCCAHGR